MVPVTRTGNATKDMSAIMERVRRMSDSQLADILAGKDVSIPQFAAMTEAMGRKQLRQAVDGAQAQQQAQQPSIKDQLLAEQQAPSAGIAGLPAPNMESMNMAGGGIIAFDNGGGVYDDPLAYLSGQDVQSLGTDEARREALLARRKALEDKERLEFLKTAAPDVAARLISESTPTPPPAAAAPNTAAVAPVVKPNAPPAPPAATPKSDIDVSQATKFERRASPFAAMAPEAQDYEKLKSQGLGEGLMKMAAGLLSAPGSKGFAAGIQALAESGQVSRKEINALKKDARDYDLNLKKADAAFEQGNDELGLKYTEAANLNKYRMASLAKEPDALVTARAALKDPKIAALIGKEGKAELYSVEAATKAFNDILKDNRTYAKELAALGVRDPLSYRQFVINGLANSAVSATVPEGAKTRS